MIRKGGKQLARPRLSYFNLKARAHVPRLMLVHAQVPHDWRVLEGEEWTKFKKENSYEGNGTGVLAWGQLPLYEEPYGNDGTLSLVQSGTITRYLARKHSYEGSNAAETADIDMVYEGFNDLYSKYVKLKFYPDPKSGEEKAFVNEQLPGWLTSFDRILGKKKYFVGSKPSYADFGGYHVLTSVEEFSGAKDQIKKFPNLVAFVSGINSLPTISTFNASNPYPANKK